MTTNDPRSLLGPRASAALDGMEGEHLPRDRCQHLMADASLHQRIYARWHRSEVTCPSCTLDHVSLLRHAGRQGTWRMICGWCLAGTSEWTTIHRDLGSVVLMAALCPDCIHADERDFLIGRDASPPILPVPRLSTSRLAWSSR